MSFSRRPSGDLEGFTGMGVLLAEPLLSGQVQEAHALGVGVVVQVGVLDGPGNGVGTHARLVVIGGLAVV
ncbi:hypothetical protein QP448_13165, partial [Staphylococcus haemolyticus]|nr:hypothetical protein [Staphylococcus haemolyticus]